MSKFDNNINSKFIIINIKVLEIDYKYTFIKLNNIIIDWIEESLIKKYNKKLNWNIGIIYPTEFYLTNPSLQNNYNQLYLLENKIIKIIVYIDNKLYPSFNINNLLYTNEYDINDNDLILNNINNYGLDNFNSNTHLNEIILDINHLNKCLNINSNIFSIKEPNFIDSISISGVDKQVILHELDILKLGNKFTNSNFITDFIYLKNIHQLGLNKLIKCNDPFINFYDNLLYNT